MVDFHIFLVAEVAEEKKGGKYFHPLTVMKYLKEEGEARGDHISHIFGQFCGN